MKTLILTSLLFFATAGINIQAQDNVRIEEKSANEKYGKTLNLGLGIGYYRAIDPHRALVQQLHQPRAAQRCIFWHIAGQSLIKALGRFGLNGKRDKGRAHG